MDINLHITLFGVLATVGAIALFACVVYVIIAVIRLILMFIFIR